MEGYMASSDSDCEEWEAVNQSSESNSNLSGLVEWGTEAISKEHDTNDNLTKDVRAVENKVEPKLENQDTMDESSCNDQGSHPQSIAESVVEPSDEMADLRALVERLRIGKRNINHCEGSMPWLAADSEKIEKEMTRLNNNRNTLQKMIVELKQVELLADSREEMFEIHGYVEKMISFWQNISDDMLKSAENWNASLLAANFTKKTENQVVIKTEEPAHAGDAAVPAELRELIDNVIDKAEHILQKKQSGQVPSSAVPKPTEEVVVDNEKSKEEDYGFEARLPSETIEFMKKFVERTINFNMETCTGNDKHVIPNSIEWNKMSGGYYHEIRKYGDKVERMHFRPDGVWRNGMRCFIDGETVVQQYAPGLFRRNGYKYKYPAKVNHSCKQTEGSTTMDWSINIRFK